MPSKNLAAQRTAATQTANQSYLSCKTPLDALINRYIAHQIVQTNTHAHIYIYIYTHACLCVAKLKSCAYLQPCVVCQWFFHVLKLGLMLCHLMILNAHFSLLNAWLKINACTHDCVHRKKCCSGWKPSRLLPRRSLRWNGHYGVDSPRWFETMKCIEMSWSSGDPICQPPSTMLAIIWGVNQTVPEAKKTPTLHCGAKGSLTSFPKNATPPSNTTFVAKYSPKAASLRIPMSLMGFAVHSKKSGCTDSMW